MSNNPYKRKRKAVQIGNFFISQKKGVFRSTKISSAAGNWSIIFLQDHPLYRWINNQLNTEEGQKILNLVFSSYYAICSGVPDKEFLEDIINAYTRSVERLKESQETLSEEDDKKIIDDEKTKYTAIKDDTAH